MQLAGQNVYGNFTFTLTPQNYYFEKGWGK
jgi:hypothetical protein